MAIEAKLQETSGSAFEKLSYALDDCMAAPIPSIIVFSGRYIRDDMKAKLISSGHGIEVGYENGAIADRYELLKQRIYAAAFGGTRFASLLYGWRDFGGRHTIPSSM